MSASRDAALRAAPGPSPGERRPLGPGRHEGGTVRHDTCHEGPAAHPTLARSTSKPCLGRSPKRLGQGFENQRVHLVNRTEAQLVLEPPRHPLDSLAFVQRWWKHGCHLAVRLVKPVEEQLRTAETPAKLRQQHKPTHVRNQIRRTDGQGITHPALRLAPAAHRRGAARPPATRTAAPRPYSPRTAAGSAASPRMTRDASTKAWAAEPRLTRRPRPAQGILPQSRAGDAGKTGKSLPGTEGRLPPGAAPRGGGDDREPLEHGGNRNTRLDGLRQQATGPPGRSTPARSSRRAPRARTGARCRDGRVNHQKR